MRSAISAFVMEHPNSTRSEIVRGVAPGRAREVAFLLDELFRGGKLERAGVGRRGAPFRYRWIKADLRMFKPREREIA